VSYTAIWLVLVGLTLGEVALAWVRLAAGPMLALLLALSLAKAGLIAWFFMHLKTRFPGPLRLLIPMLFFCIGLLLMLLPDGVRAWTMR
jgi:caa(3)-type oxidase subunit IV